MFHRPDVPLFIANQHPIPLNPIDNYFNGITPNSLIMNNEKWEWEMRNEKREIRNEKREMRK